MVTNPVDTLTQVALDCLGWPRERVIGSGTVLDSARFKFMLSQHCNVDARNVQCNRAPYRGAPTNARYNSIFQAVIDYEIIFFQNDFRRNTRI